MFSDTFLLLTVVCIFVVICVLAFGISRMVIRWLLDKPGIDPDTLAIAISISFATSLIPPVILWNMLIILRSPSEPNAMQLLAYSAGTVSVVIVILWIVFADKIRAIRGRLSEAAEDGSDKITLS